jgi:hypothetical protein
LASQILGGISLDSIFTSRTGLPINVVMDRPASAIPDGNNTDHHAHSPNLRPDRVPGVSLIPPEGRSNLPGGRWINPAAFATPANGTWGNAPRNPVRGPNLWQADLGTRKRFPIYERVSGDFEASIFNVFNRSQYANASGDFTLAAAGSTATFSSTTTTINSGATGSGTPRRIQFSLRFNY